MTLEDVIRKVRIECDVRSHLHKAKGSYELKVYSNDARVNLLERGDNSKKRPHPGNEKSKASSSQKFSGNYFNCDKPGHMSKDCHKPKKKKTMSSANLAEREITNDDLAVVVSEEVNVVENQGQWFIDTAATAHVCADRSLFSN